jgi:hypothetical protein
LIPWIATATFILSIKQFIFDNGLHVTQQNWPHLFTMMPTVLISIGLGIFLIRSHGIFGAAINYVVVATVATLVSAIFSFRVLSFAIPWRNLAKAALSVLIATAATRWMIHHVAWGVVGTLIAGAIIFWRSYLKPCQVPSVGRTSGRGRNATPQTSPPRSSQHGASLGQTPIRFLPPLRLPGQSRRPLGGKRLRSGWMTSLICLSGRRKSLSWACRYRLRACAQQTKNAMTLATGGAVSAAKRRRGGAGLCWATCCGI